MEKRLNLRNTLVKVGLDQTLGATVNTAAYIGASRLLRGAPLNECWEALREVWGFPLCIVKCITDRSLKANVARHESRIQALASCESGPARVHTRREQDSGWKLGRNGMGSIFGNLCSLIALLAELKFRFSPLSWTLQQGKYASVAFVFLNPQVHT